MRWLQHPVTAAHAAGTSPGEQRPEVTDVAANTGNAEQVQPGEPIVGQQQAKRALALAAAGGHHLLMVGPPGTGKSLLARMFRKLYCQGLEPRDRSWKIAAVYSVAGLPRPGNVAKRHFAIHISPRLLPPWSAAAASLVRAKSHWHTAAYCFSMSCPISNPASWIPCANHLETGRINIVRANWQAAFPARFQLIAAMNPCPAGLVCNDQDCRCRPDQVQRYQTRVSGPLLDRIDLHVPVPPKSQPQQLLNPDPGTTGSNRLIRGISALHGIIQLARQGTTEQHVSPAIALQQTLCAG